MLQIFSETSLIIFIKWIENERLKSRDNVRMKTIKTGSASFAKTSSGISGVMSLWLTLSMIESINSILPVLKAKSV